MRRISLLALAAVCCVPLAAALAAPPPGGEPAEVGQSTLDNVPVSGLHISPMPGINTKNPYAGDPSAVMEGEKLFRAMNCNGCHAPGAGGGMGPALSDDVWIYGSTPGQIYLTIMHGRPNGMPAWGSTLPPQAIWALVTYIKTLQRPVTQYEPVNKLSGPPKQQPKKAMEPKKRPPQGPKNPKPPSPPPPGGSQ